MDTLKKSLLIAILIGLASCSSYYYPPLKVETRIEKVYSYKSTPLSGYSKWRKYEPHTKFERYDKNGNIIEEGEYGEIEHFRDIKKNKDSSETVISGHYYNFKKINTVHYYQYDSTKKVVLDELWRFKDNKKNYLVSKTVYEYDVNGHLAKETEYDQKNEVRRSIVYSENKSHRTTATVNTEKVFHEGINRVDTIGQDTTITDSLNRPISKIHYFRNKFLYREEFRYSKDENMVTVLIYDENLDNLSSIKEFQYDDNRKLIRVFWKEIGSETKSTDIYIYDWRDLLIKIKHFRGDELEGYTKYKYTLYKPK